MEKFYSAIGKQRVPCRFAEQLSSSVAPCAPSAFSGTQWQELESLGPVDWDYLFPLALQVPGCQHIIDLTIRDSLSSQGWWPWWEAAAKSICQFLRVKGNRVLLKQRIQQSTFIGGPEKEDLKKKIGAGICSFADWRWQTLLVVCHDLLRVECALRSPGVAHHLGDARFQTSVYSDSTWLTAKLLATSLQPLFDFSGWVKGCPCHEQERLQRAKESLSERKPSGSRSLLAAGCSRCGLRAAELSARVTQVLRELREARDHIDVTGNSLVSVADAQKMLSTAMALTRSKFAWTEDVPYFIWQVGLSEPMSVSCGSRMCLRQHLRCVRRVATLCCFVCSAWPV